MAWRYLAAHKDLIEGDELFSTSALARRMRMSRAALARFHHEHPDIASWVSACLQDEAQRMVGAVLRKMAELALGGSAEHAEVLVRFAGGAVAAALGGNRDVRVKLDGPLSIQVGDGSTTRIEVHAARVVERKTRPARGDGQRVRPQSVRGAIH